ncbi:uncharacterized protein LOC113521370 [Galleria mellonella]|uniref:Uncharacterized protein LOC113521370 n=1 Tax=Galleria mellonella TaxID=7137 RepID=A0A6J1X7H6_GALME|nr:uncharacterized protein LOC113521370 [Galleria mellonella]
MSTKKSQAPISPWIKRIIEETEKEGSEEWPIVLLKGESRHAVWVVSAWLGVDMKGIPGQACRLLERFLCARTRQLVTESTSTEELKRIQRSINEQIIFFLACCILLASKMNTSTSNFNSHTIQRYMQLHGLEISVDKINAMEHDVFSSLGYQISLFSSVEAAELISLEVGLSSKMIEHVGTLTNLAEYRRDELVRLVKKSSTLFPLLKKPENASLRTLHISAGTVATGIFYHLHGEPVSSSTFIKRLKHLTRLSSTFLRFMADAIAQVITKSIDDDDSEEPVTKKKKKSSKV